jgi:hypothetical protein
VIDHQRKFTCFLVQADLAPLHEIRRQREQNRKICIDQVIKHERKYLSPFQSEPSDTAAGEAEPCFSSADQQAADLLVAHKEACAAPLSQARLAMCEGGNQSPEKHDA